MADGAPSASPCRPTGARTRRWRWIAEGMARCGRLRRRGATGGAARARRGAVAHGAHGYLLHSSSRRSPTGARTNTAASSRDRMRFPLEVFDAVRAAFPPERAVTMRVSGTDWVGGAGGGWDIEQTIAFAESARGAAAAPRSTCRAAGSDRRAEDPGRTELPGAARPRRQSRRRRADRRSGADHRVRSGRGDRGTGDADLVALARTVLYDPRWPWHAAARFRRAASERPKQYLRSQPRHVRGLFI